MTQDHNKKSLRQFQCRDYLWEIFEQMGAELECSTDYLVNEAMRQYARSRNWGARSNAVGAPPVSPAAPAAPSRPEAIAASPPMMPQRATQGVGTAPPLPSANRVPQHTPQAGTARARTTTTGSNAMRPPGGTVPPPLPGGGAPAIAVQGAEMPPLSVIFNGQKVPVNKEEFVIGRGSKTADLPIKDGNISRRHAAIVLQNGNFYMKDLGSTNGIEFNGERVETRLIQEGDVYQLCDYELRCTYQ